MFYVYIGFEEDISKEQKRDVLNLLRVRGFDPQQNQLSHRDAFNGREDKTYYIDPGYYNPDALLSDNHPYQLALIIEAIDGVEWAGVVERSEKPKLVPAAAYPYRLN